MDKERKDSLNPNKASVCYDLARILQALVETEGYKCFCWPYSGEANVCGAEIMIINSESSPVLSFRLTYRDAKFVFTTCYCRRDGKLSEESEEEGLILTSRVEDDPTCAIGLGGLVPEGIEGFFFMTKGILRAFVERLGVSLMSVGCISSFSTEKAMQKLERLSQCEVFCADTLKINDGVSNEGVAYSQGDACLSMCYSAFLRGKLESIVIHAKYGRFSDDFKSVPGGKGLVNLDLSVGGGGFDSVYTCPIMDRHCTCAGVKALLFCAGPKDRDKLRGFYFAIPIRIEEELVIKQKLKEQCQKKLD